ncbi:MAG TPA: glycosyltransferase family 39 protein [Planctomycetota bacterium]|nr:glycosyltransferase family 39 protein [Planctomycetota bacterium]
MSWLRRIPAWCWLWALASLPALALRPAFPIDETRYLAVAWDMWRRRDFLVPHLAGGPYSDKPPLLFWLMHAGWAVVGVSEAWARLVPALGALLSLLLTARLARRLWPDRPDVARRAPLLLQACVLFTAWSTFLMFDTLMTACVLAVLLAALTLARRTVGAAAPGPGVLPALLLCGLCLGAAFLAKGPVVLLYVLPALLLVPLWWPRPQGAHPWRRFRLGLLAAVVIGAAVALAWVLPAATRGGPDYGAAILWGQISRRVAGEVEHLHAQPPWFYVAVLPLCVLPLLGWPRLWHALRAQRAAPRDDGVRLCVLWLLLPVLTLSLAASKQEHYLLPVLPALALLGARALSGREEPGARGEALAAGLLLMLPGAAALALRAGWVTAEVVDARALSLAPAVAALLLGAWIALSRPGTPDAALLRFAAAPALLVLCALLVFMPGILPRYDVRPVARALADVQASGRPVAFLGRYRGQFDFAGRLAAPIAQMPAGELRAWEAAHPDGVVVMEPADHGPPDGQPLASFPSGFTLWDASMLLSRAPSR